MPLPKSSDPKTLTENKALPNPPFVQATPVGFIDFEPLSNWFKQSARALPWRIEPTAWSVLLSEMMLQQTQVATVIDYFKRWIERFPSPKELALASEEEVLKLWEGLGYYRRARSLHSAAKAIDARGGEIPSNSRELLAIPGIGPYTSAAILAFAFKQRTAAVDGNVMRVMTRLLGLEIDISRPSSGQLIREKLLTLLPEVDSVKAKPWIVSEALIELGALICRKKPLCDLCPLQAQCYASQNERQAFLPITTRVSETVKLTRSVAIIVSPLGRYLVRQKRSKGVFFGLWMFPYLEKEELEDLFQPRASEFSAINEKMHGLDPWQETELFQEELGLKLTLTRALKRQKHTFTKYSAQLLPGHFVTPNEREIASSEDWHYEWVDSKQLQDLTFCSGYREIRREINHSLSKAIP